jgi:hypothetical protein
MKQTYVDISFTFDRWNEEIFIFTTTVDACVQCLVDEDILPSDPKLTVKGYEELFNDYSDWLYEYFYEEAYDEWNKEYGPKL